jgi:hypothetical protein
MSINRSGQGHRSSQHASRGRVRVKESFDTSTRRRVRVKKRNDGEDLGS